MKKQVLLTAAMLCVALPMGSASADMAAAEKWIDNEFQPSALSRDAQIAEMKWFIDAAAP